MVPLERQHVLSSNSATSQATPFVADKADPWSLIRTHPLDHI